MHIIKFSKKIVILLLTCIFITMAVSACAEDTVTDEEKAQAEIIIDNILEGFETNNFDLFSQDFSSDLLTDIGKSDFVNTANYLNDNMGTAEQRELVSALKTRDQCMFGYQVQYSLTSDIIIFVIHTYETEGQTLVVFIDAYPLLTP